MLLISRTDQLGHPRKWGYGALGICYPHYCFVVIRTYDFLGSLKDLHVAPNPSFVLPDRGSLRVGKFAQMDASASHLASETSGLQILVNGPLEDEDLR